MKIQESDVLTGEVIIRDGTIAELAQRKDDADGVAAKIAELDARATAKAELFTRLGITADEAKLLLG